MSRLKSARGAKAPAPRAAAAARPAARAAGARGVYVQAPKSDVFVVMLGIALGAILLGCLLLGLVMNRYDFKTKPTARAFTPGNAATLAFEKNSGDAGTVRL